MQSVLAFKKAVPGVSIGGGIAVQRVTVSTEAAFSFASGISSKKPKPLPIQVTYLPVLGPKAILPAVEDD